jgi:hypothetical protein
MNDELIQDIKSRLYTSTGKISYKKINLSLNKELCKRILDITNFLLISASYSERFYCIFNNIKTQPVCNITNTPLTFNKNKHTYNTVNKLTPKTVSEESIELFKESISRKNRQITTDIINKYNSRNFNLLSKTDLKNFITKFREKYRNMTPSLAIRYIDEICSLMHYTDNGFIKGQYTLKLFGERCYLIINDMTEPPCCIDDTSIKATYTNFNIGYRKITSNKSRILLYNNTIKHDVINQGFTIINDESIFNLKDCDFLLKCNKCGHITSKKLTNGRWKHIYCQGCYGNNQRSQQEQEIINYIKSITTTNIICNHKFTSTGKEIDIFLPDKNIGIEYNGILWHSYGCTFPNNIRDFNKKYHINDKRKQCEKLGIRVINILDSEWIYKKEILKSMIRSKLHIPSNTTIFARKCNVVLLNNQIKSSFLENNHLQGNDNSSFYLGLAYNNEIVSIMTFGRRKITGKTSFELIRFCNKLNTHIPGGASKLFKFFIKNYWKGETIVTYADLRYSEGNLYDKLGFKFKHESSPNYFYTKDSSTLESRVKYQKHKLSSKLDIFDNTKTEMQNMIDNNYRVIFDCGNKVYEYNII